MQQATNIALTHRDLPVDVATLQAEVLYLRHELDKLRRLIFGQKRERFVPVVNIEQLDIQLDDQRAETAPVKLENVSYTRTATTKKTPHGRNPLPAHLPRKDHVIEPEQEITNLKKIGDEITEELEYEPGKLYVNRYIRPKYALPLDNADGAGNDGPDASERDFRIIIANLPTRPIEKGIAGPGLLSHVLVSKYVDHLPLYRQCQQLKRQDVTIPLSTMTDWVRQSADVLTPLYNELKSNVLAAPYLQADESPIKVLDKMKQGSTHLGYMWLYHAPLTGLVLFDYREGRSRAGPNEILQNFSGYLQTDAYAGYNDITAKPDVIALACFSHARRYFKDAQSVDAERANWMLSEIQKLYKLEEQARADQLDHAARYQLRQTYALPVLAGMKSWLDEQSKHVLPKSALGKAIGYALTQWSRLIRYTENGMLEIDNNWIENLVRPLALGRKNYLFAGSHDGARRAAIIYSLVATAKKHGVEPFAYLRDVLARIADHPFKQLHELLPSNWTPADNA